jgi:hypothetical protein
MSMFAKPVTAIVFGVFMFCAETCLHADTLLNVATAPLDLPYYDWTAAGFLAGAGVLSRRRLTDTRRQYQAVAWGFMLSLLTGAFLGSLSEWFTPPASSEWGISEAGFVIIIAALMVVALCGVVSTSRHDDGEGGITVQRPSESIDFSAPRIT